MEAINKLEGYSKEPMIEDAKETTEPTKRLTKWLTLNYVNNLTKRGHINAIVSFLCFIYKIDSCKFFARYDINKSTKESYEQEAKEGLRQLEIGIDKYVNEIEEENRIFIDDIKNYIIHRRETNHSSYNIHNYFSSNKIFFASQSKKCKIEDEELKGLNRTLIPKAMTQTQDDILTKEQFQQIFQHSAIHTKALVLFLLSTGARIGETLQLKMTDINLDADPPEVNFKGSYTKKGLGGRIMWFSYEARDAIKAWHIARIGRRKRGGKGRIRNYFDQSLVFNFTNPMEYAKVWSKTLKRVDPLNSGISKRDTNSLNRTHIFHTHTLRKFFITQMQRAGCPEIYWQTWVAHTGYLGGSYSRPSRNDLKDTYKKYMHLVTIQTLSTEEKDKIELDKAKSRWEKAEKEAEDRLRKIHTSEDFVNQLARRLKIPEDLSLEAKQDQILTQLIYLQGTKR
ncbi:site-specific integrase [Candidatus Bathyarchaeota archaeon]|nr:site-specific integrase [Candidatus Bathyarchaeota archaeon]